MNRKGIFFVVSAPSGTGKTTICDRLLKNFVDLKMSISHTTRKPRENERHGVDYYFVDKETFGKMIQNEEFIEWAEVYGNFYGTSKKVIDSILKDGNDILFDIDTQGARNIKKIYPDSVLIFILPPNINELERRLINRGEAAENIKMRLQKFKDEISQYEFYDYLVINDDLEKAFREISCIISAERLKTSRIVQKLTDKY